MQNSTQPEIQLQVETGDLCGAVRDDMLPAEPPLCLKGTVCCNPTAAYRTPTESVTNPARSQS